MGKNFTVLLGAQIFLCFGGLAIPPLIPFFQPELELTYSQVGSIMSFLYLGAILMSLPAGWITDRLGVKKTIVFSLIFSGFFVALLGLIESYLAAVFFTFLVGLGYGMSNPPTTKGIMVLASDGNRGLAMSAKQTGVPIAGGLAAAVLPPLALLISWKFSFVLAGAAIFLAGLLSQVLYRSAKEQNPLSRPAAEEVPRREWGKILKNRNMILLSVAGAFCALVQSSLFTYTILYLKDARGFELIRAALCLTLMNGGGILGRIFWGILSDRLFRGSRKIVLQLLVSLIFLITLVLALDLPLSPLVLTSILFVLGASAIGWNGVYHAFIGEMSGKEMAGRATGLAMAIVFMGGAMGPILFGRIVDAYHSYRAAWFFLCAAMAGAFVVYGLIQETGSTDPGKAAQGYLPDDAAEKL
ncbi:MAG: MFS transporter [Deltaproteobacteria bacterium]|nr:MFS transporter [Deltaproteobacteria bacterium]